MKEQHYAYFCDGHKDCYGNPECKLACKDGVCEHTTDLSYAVNRKKIIFDENYHRTHMVKVADSDFEEWWMEE